MRLPIVPATGYYMLSLSLFSEYTSEPEHILAWELILS